MTNCKAIVSQKTILGLKSYAILSFILSVLISTHCFGTEDSKMAGLSHPAKILFVNPNASGLTIEETNDVASLKNSLFIAGFDVTEVSANMFNSLKISIFDVLIIPSASAKELNQESAVRIKKAVNAGTFLVF